MFIFKKLVTPFILPPGLFILVLLAVGFWQLTRRKWRPGFFLVTLGLTMWFAATPPMAHLMTRYLENQYPLPANPQGDVIVMLGGAIYEGAPDLSGLGAPSASAAERLLTTARIHRRTGLPIILSGGNVWKERKVLMGPIYKRFLTDLGVPADRIFLENRSRDTFENALFTAELCRQKGYRQPIVVTHALHMPRAILCFTKVDMPATPFPCAFRTWPDKTHYWINFFPAGYSDLADALHECLGLLYYRLLN
jgi:uncharacterized SAM-binding protein YcdF (DUF218 family)